MKNKLKKIVGKAEDGFSFVETLAVLAIGAVLTGGTLVSSSKMISMAKKTAAKSQISQFSSALQCYFLDCGRFPTSEQGLDALWEKPNYFPVPDSWNGPYMDKKPGKDPWGSEYKYYSAETGDIPNEVPDKLPYALLSYGADKKPGGEGEDTDIVSWE